MALGADSRVPRQLSYGLAGLALSLGAPAGLCLLRWLRGGPASLAWLRQEIAGDLTTYLYVAVSTAVVFFVFGFALGRQADRLIELSRTDPLTGLANGRVLHERLEAEFARSLRYGSPLSLLVIDLDGLKEINDRQGHQAGDEALVLVAAAIRGGARSTDVGARYGGDEFALLAPNTPASAARALAERVRLLVSENGIADPAITASVGVATLDPSTPPAAPRGLMDAADRALYEAKRLGRNRVAVASAT